MKLPIFACLTFVFSLSVAFAQERAAFFDMDRAKARLAQPVSSPGSLPKVSIPW